MRVRIAVFNSLRSYCYWDSETGQWLLDTDVSEEMGRDLKNTLKIIINIESRNAVHVLCSYFLKFSSTRFDRVEKRESQKLMIQTSLRMFINSIRLERIRKL